jgi:uncharacterized protein (DUF2336 family)
MTSSSLLSELEIAVKSGTPEKRVETLRRVTSLFLDTSNHLNEQQIAVFDDVLIHLIKRIETTALVQLSTALAPVDNAPIEVVRSLSHHDEIAVAGPVLAQSNRLSESDLVTIAKQFGQRHMLAVSKRASLTEAVTDVLVDRGHAPVHHALANNSGARFSEAGFASLVAKSAKDESLAEKLGRRLDIPWQLLCQLLARATDLVRSKLLASAPPENRGKILAALAGIADEIAREAVSPRDFAPADNIVLELNRRGKLNETALVEFIKQGKYEEMTAALALFCAAKSDLIERLMKNMRYEGLLIACKAADLTWPTVALLLETRFSHHAMTGPELLSARDAYTELSRAAAQRSIRFMQVQGAVKKAS